MLQKKEVAIDGGNREQGFLCFKQLVGGGRAMCGAYFAAFMLLEIWGEMTRN